MSWGNCSKVQLPPWAARVHLTWDPAEPTQDSPKVCVCECTHMGVGSAGAFIHQLPSILVERHRGPNFSYGRRDVLGVLESEGWGLVPGAHWGS